MKIAPALVAALLFMPPTALRAADAAAAKPNIVIFIADDLSWFDVACFGGPTGAKTPHLDRLAHEGLKLTGFFSPASVCSPTRQSLLTGLYPVRSGAYPNHSQVRPGTKSLPHFLRALGYRSACVGKTHFGPAASFPFDTMLPMRGEKPGDVFAQHTGRGIINGPDAYGTRAVRDKRWKLIVNLHPDVQFRNALTKTPVFRSWLRKAGEGDEFARTQSARYTRRPAVELYDLQADPWEMNNVAAKPEHAEVVARLRTQLDSWMRQQGDEGDKTEREAHEHQARARAGKKAKSE